MVRIGTHRGWPVEMMAQIMGVKIESLKDWIKRNEKKPPGPASKLGRPEVVPAEVKLKIRNCYVAHYKQWGASVLAQWAEREGLGRYSPSTISKVIEDLKEKEPPKEKPRRYEIVAPNVMWSEDGAGFKERGKKKELLILQDECSRFKVNTKLAKGPANGKDVYQYLREAFEKHGPPLILKHDGDSIFSEGEVQKLMEKHHVVDLKSPPYYPLYNGKMERSVRDIRGYERAMRRKHLPFTLRGRIEAAIHDLNEERPRPMLGGKTSREVFENEPVKLPDRKKFYEEVERREETLVSDSCSRKQKDYARRRAVKEVLLGCGLMVESAEVTSSSNQEIETS